MYPIDHSRYDEQTINDNTVGGCVFLATKFKIIQDLSSSLDDKKRNLELGTWSQTNSMEENYQEHQIIIQSFRKKKMATNQPQSPQIQYSEQAVQAMLTACANGEIQLVKGYLDESRQHSNPPLAAALQDQKTGISPLIAAAEAGHLELCTHLLEEGAPWNAVDRMGKCAGNYATEKQHWDVVNLLVDAGTRAEVSYRL